MFWNLYIDDLTLLEVVESLEVDKNGKVVKSGWQEMMERTYSSLGVPFSQEKASSRELICEKLGALLDGKNGRLGVTTKRSLDFISLGLFLLSVDKAPTKWVQILLGKYVHVLQFRRPLFSQVNWLWKRIGAFNRGNAFSAEEVEEVFRMMFLLPLCYTDLRAKVSQKVSCSDASETGGGVCASTGTTSLGKMGLTGLSAPISSGHDFLVIEWFAGIGGLSRSLERLGLFPKSVAVCEQDPHCLAVLRKFLPGCEVWKDIRSLVRDFQS